MDNLSPQFSYATLSVEAGMWRIVWYNWHPVKQCQVRVRKTFALNRIQNKAKRRNAANEVINRVNEGLDIGWNYFIHVEGIPGPLQPQRPLQPQPTVLPAAQPTISIVAALDEALKIRKLGKKPRTADTYRHYINKLIEWLKKNDLAGIACTDFTGQMFQKYLFSKSNDGHGNRNLNEHTGFFKTTFEVIRKQLKLITVNPIEHFDYLPEADSQKFLPLTSDEIARIVPALIAYNPRFYIQYILQQVFSLKRNIVIVNFFNLQSPPLSLKSISGLYKAIEP